MYPVSVARKDSNMKANDYKVLNEAIERGVNYGYNRAFKYTSSPDTEHVINTIIEAVKTEISEWFDFDVDSLGIDK